MSNTLQNLQGERLRRALWLCNVLPFGYGNVLRNWLVGYASPFTGHLGARVSEARPGSALLELSWGSRIEAGKYANFLKAEVMPMFTPEEGACLGIEVRRELLGANGSLHPVAMSLLCTQTAQVAIASKLPGQRFKLRSLKGTFGYRVTGWLSTSCVLSAVGDRVTAEARLYSDDDVTVATVVTEWVRRGDEEGDFTGTDPLALLHIGEEAGRLAFLSQLPAEGEAFLSALEMEIEQETGGTVTASSRSVIPVLPEPGAKSANGGAARLEYDALAAIKLGDRPVAHVTSRYSVGRARASARLALQN
jgi:hypothetical protein